MVKSKKELQSTTIDEAKACLLCQKKDQNIFQLCDRCYSWLWASSESSIYFLDRDLFEAFKQKRAIDKANYVKKLVYTISAD